MAEPILREAAVSALCTNEDAGALKPYSVLGIQSSWDTDDKVETRRLLKGRLVTANDLRRWVVTAEPLAQGEAGRVWVCGVCLCLVTGAEDDCAKAVVGAKTLTCCGEDDVDASAQVLWTASGEGERLGLIRFWGNTP